jgi:hypothetical protein
MQACRASGFPKDSSTKTSVHHRGMRREQPGEVPLLEQADRHLLCRAISQLLLCSRRTILRGAFSCELVAPRISQGQQHKLAEEDRSLASYISQVIEADA